MKKMMILSKNYYFSVQKASIYYTVNKSHHNSLILLVFSHVANFRYVANFRFLTLPESKFGVVLRLSYHIDWGLSYKNALHTPVISHECQNIFRHGL